MEALRSLASKSLALLLLALAAAVLVFGIALPVVDRYQELEAEIATKRMLLGRLLAEPDVPKQAQASQPTPSGTHLQGETDAVRLAALQSIMNDAASAQGIRLISSRSVDASERDGVRLLGVSAQLNAPMDALQKLLFDLESNHGALAVESFHIMRPPGDRQTELDVSLVLRGTAPSRRE